MTVEQVLAAASVLISALLGIVIFFLKNFYDQTSKLAATVQQMQVSAAGFAASALALSEGLQSVADEVKELRAVHERLARAETRLDMLEKQQRGQS